jgi:hypothetical protein
MNLFLAIYLLTQKITYFQEKLKKLIYLLLCQKLKKKIIKKNKKQNKKLSESSQTDTIGSCQTHSQFPPIP